MDGTAESARVARSTGGGVIVVLVVGVVEERVGQRGGLEDTNVHSATSQVRPVIHVRVEWNAVRRRRDFNESCTRVSKRIRATMTAVRGPYRS